MMGSCQECGKNCRDTLCWSCRKRAFSGSNKSRGIHLTEKGLRAIGVIPMVEVPLLDIPFRKDEGG